ncbi:tRNA pseudouridine(38-40) synthase TruA [Helicobacter sp. 13S00477-4]|uniref:tRNA pseudouridine(38-40) synthase TruA n=1 Tax=Helicobacter sp. 13S00477-4 TaxID=1905759 RepID=UPI000BA789F8|nr:tRNA pseudouridine(38-40) synthase TruA [Helicobacter sp. 13S00477-4]PAF51557.1 tRNA pseudouridine(38-40) synthase TruA [Helicobacter sp. 13S00477-4]
MKRLVGKIAYDGSGFSGFARQKTVGILSVVEKIESALRSMGIEDEVLAASRTDKGVHATGQIISFCVCHQMDIDKIKSLLNQKLYPHIFVKNLQETDMLFHPRFNAKRRGYRYIFCKDYLNPFIAKYISKQDFRDKKLITQALNLFLGRHNFGYFKKKGSHTKDDFREIFLVRFYEYRIFSQECYVIYLEADGFLRTQVRLMLGSVLAYSKGEIGLDDIFLQLECKKRIFTYPVSGNGLYLARVIY